MDVFLPTPLRKNLLRSSYFFDCLCERCNCNAPDEDAFLEGFACDQCSGTSESVRILDSEKRVLRCYVCAHETHIDKEFEKLFSEWQSALKSSDTSLLSLERQWKVAELLQVHYKNAERANTARALSNAWLSNPSCSEIERQLRALHYTFEEYQATEWILPTRALPSRGLLCLSFARILSTLAEMKSSKSVQLSARLCLFLQLESYSSHALPLLEAARTLLHQALFMYVLYRNLQCIDAC